MAEIIPAILEEEFTLVGQKIKLLEGLTDWVQLDVTDGLFAPKISWQEPNDLKNLSPRLKIEIHLMVDQPESEIEKWLAVADRLIVHQEATLQLEAILKRIKAAGKSNGVALLLPTPLNVLEPSWSEIELVQLMGIQEIGFQGHLLDRRVIQKIQLLGQARPNVKIAVDGGVNLNNAEELLAAGVDQLIVGSAVWQSQNPIQTLRQFQELSHAFTRRQNQIS